MWCAYTIEGTYCPRDTDQEQTFKDTVMARSAEHAFTSWEKKHHEKPLLRFESIEPLI